jgi:D-3-phosphoglycerate dehydrogenase
VPPEAVEVAQRCLVVSRYGVGVDNIPVDRASELGIVVTNVPDFCLDEVSDHAMALLLACARRVVTFADSTAAGEWRLLELGRGLPRLRGQVLGLVGFGNIARALVPKARAFGLEVLAYTPRLQAGTLDGVETTSDLSELLERADYVSLHAPANAETRGMIGEAELRQMKPTAYLINTSRGALIDEPALRRAVDEGWIAGAGLDVTDPEPIAPDDPLLGAPNLLVLPHVGSATHAARERMADRAVDNLLAALDGRPMPYPAPTTAPGR